MDPTEVLLFIFRNHRGQALSLNQLQDIVETEYVNNLQSWKRSRPYLHPSWWWYGFNDSQLRKWLEGSLQNLQRLDLIEPGNSNSNLLPEAGFPTWTMKGEWGGTGEPPQGPGGGKPPPEGEDFGPGGFREVLTHPILFSVSDEDFNELLDANLGDAR